MATGSPRAAAADAPGHKFFEKKIRPVLVEHCYRCHSADAKEIGGGLRLDDPVMMRSGGESGPAVAEDSRRHRSKGRVHLHDLHATILHIPGLDHKRLTYRYAGRDFRLTDVHGNVITDLLA